MRFSICIPAYKSKFLVEAIESILKQSFLDFELIILNDCSPEPVEEIVKSFSDDRLIYFKNEKNVGAELLVHNWNFCLSKASGEFIMIMGDDDILRPNYLEEFNNLISRFPNKFVYHCRSIIINSEGDYLRLSPSWPEHESVYDNILHRLDGKRAQFISDFVYNRKALIDSGEFVFLPLAWGSDDITAYKMSIYNGIAHTNNPIFLYRSNNLTITSTGNEKIKMKADLIYFNWIKEFLENEPNDEIDKITYNVIKNNLKKFLIKKQIYTLSTSFRTSIFSYSIYWILNRAKYKLSIPVIVFSILISLKNRLARKI